MLPDRVRYTRSGPFYEVVEYAEAGVRHPSQPMVKIKGLRLEPVWGYLSSAVEVVYKEAEVSA